MLGIGTNGGLIGPRRVPNGGSASGIWDLEEQKLAKGAGIWVRPLGTYSQSSLYSGATAASRANMTNGSFTDTATATDAATGGASAFVKVDYGESVYITTVTIGTATGNIPGGWSKDYTNNSLVQTSDDDSTWTTLFNTGTFATEGIFTFYGPGNFTPVSARYVRIAKADAYVAVSEFYVN
jgi:hypothetical protein